MLIERLKVRRHPSAVSLAHMSRQEPNTELYRPALETLRALIRTSTSSMTSVPKPLKFLHPHYPELQKLFETWSPSEDKASMSTRFILRVLSFCRVSLRTSYLSLP